MKQSLSLLLMVVYLSGCGISIQGEKYVETTPLFDPFKFFNGDVTAWGIVQNHRGELVQRFTVDIAGRVTEDGELVLDENFTYHIGDGVTHRIWHINDKGNGDYLGKADDIIGEAAGQVYGSALQWQYQMDLPVGDKTYRVSFDDWMWAFDSQSLMNRSYIKKFGLVVAEVTLFMQKNPR